MLILRRLMVLVFFISGAFSFSLSFCPNAACQVQKIQKTIEQPGRFGTLASRVSLTMNSKRLVENAGYFQDEDQSNLYDLLMEQRVMRTTTDGEEVSMAQIIGNNKALVVFMRHVG